MSESGIAAGVRRIEAVTGPGLYDLLSGRERIVRALTASLKVQPEQLEARVAGIYEEQRKLSIEVERLKVGEPGCRVLPSLTRLLQSEVALTRAEALLSRVVRLPGGVQLLVQRLDGVDATALGAAAQQLEKALGDPAAVVLGAAAADDKVCLAAAFSPSVVRQGASAGALLGPLAKLCGGGGGGKPAFAQAGGRDTARIGEALALASERIAEIVAKSSSH